MSQNKSRQKDPIRFGAEEDNGTHPDLKIEEKCLLCVCVCVCVCVCIMMHASPVNHVCLFGTLQILNFIPKRAAKLHECQAVLDTGRQAGRQAGRQMVVHQGILRTRR
jgi:hypothetical protein